jgi:hypothetical protein
MRCWPVKRANSGGGSSASPGASKGPHNIGMKLPGQLTPRQGRILHASSRSEQGGLRPALFHQRPLLAAMTTGLLRPTCRQLSGCA